MENTRKSSLVVVLAQRIALLVFGLAAMYLSLALFTAPCWVNVNPETPQWASIAGAGSFGVPTLAIGIYATMRAFCPLRYRSH